MGEKKITLRVVSPQTTPTREKYKVSQQVNMVIMRATSGDLGVLPGRVPCSMALDAGVLRIFDDEGESRMAVLGGIAHVGDDVVTILTRRAEHPGEIDVAKINAEISTTNEQIATAETLVERDKLRDKLRGLQVRLQVAGG